MNFKWTACAGKAQEIFALHDLLLKDGEQNPFSLPDIWSARH